MGKGAGVVPGGAPDCLIVQSWASSVAECQCVSAVVNVAGAVQALDVRTVALLAVIGAGRERGEVTAVLIMLPQSQRGPGCQVSNRRGQGFAGQARVLHPPRRQHLPGPARRPPPSRTVTPRTPARERVQPMVMQCVPAGEAVRVRPPRKRLVPCEAAGLAGSPKINAINWLLDPGWRMRADDPVRAADPAGGQATCGSSWRWTP